MFKKFLPFILIAITLIATIFFAKQRPNKVTSRASDSIASVSLEPSQSQLPAILNLYIDPKGSQLNFVSLAISFPKNEISLDETPLLSSSLPNVVKLTEASEANSTGKIEIISGFNPQDSPADSLTQIATLKFSAKVPNLNPSENNIMFLQNESKIIVVSQKLMPATFSNALLFTHNESETTPTITQTPTPSMAPSPTAPAPIPSPISDANCNYLNITPKKVQSLSRHRLEASAFSSTTEPKSYSWSVSTNGKKKGNFSSTDPLSIILWTAPDGPTENQYWMFTAVATTPSGKKATCQQILKF